MSAFHRMATYPLSSPKKAKLLCAFLLLILAASPAFPASDVAFFTPDPEAIGTGFSRAHWDTTTNEMIVPFGHSHDQLNSNAIKMFSPTFNSWRTVWSNELTAHNCSVVPGGGINGIQNRDNYASLFIPTLSPAINGYTGDELFIWGGSFNPPWLCNGPYYYSGRFKIPAKHVYVSGSSADPPDSCTPFAANGTTYGMITTGAFNMPTRTFIARPYNVLTPGFPNVDSTTSKHTGFDFSQDDGQIYIFGGDWTVATGHPTVSPSPSGAPGSDRNEVRIRRGHDALSRK
jgi:hypothetical protein